MKKKVLSHLRDDIKTFHKEAQDDKELIKSLKSKKGKSMKKKVVKKKMAAKRKVKRGHAKFEKVMHEYKEGKLRSGSKRGPKVKKLSQARAIAFSEDRRADKTAKGGK